MQLEITSLIALLGASFALGCTAVYLLVRRLMEGELTLTAARRSWVSEETKRADDWQHAFSTLAWSFRELHKHRSGKSAEENALSVFGWHLAELLSRMPTRRIDTANPLPERKAQIRLGLKAIEDPQLRALFEVGDVRCLSDLLALLVLRHEKPGYMLWNTEDYCKHHHGIDLAAASSATSDALG